MTPIPAHTVTEALHWRYATKKSRPREEDPLPPPGRSLEQALALPVVVRELSPGSSSSSGIRRPARSSPPRRTGSASLVDCSHFVVFAGRTNLYFKDADSYVARIAEVRGVQPEPEGIRRPHEGQRRADARGGSTRRVGGPPGVHRPRGIHDLGGVSRRRRLPDGGYRSPKFNEILGLAAQGLQRALRAPRATGRPTKSTPSTR